MAKIRKPSHRDIILDMLKKARNGTIGANGMVSNVQLCEVAFQYTGRISELRQRGHSIECVRDKKLSSLRWYRLTDNQTNMTFTTSPLNPDIDPLTGEYTKGRLNR